MASRSPAPAQRYTGARPGGRSERVRRAVLDAAGIALLSGGLNELTLAGVANAAGVHHATVYRRWPTRASLILDAIIDMTAARLPAPAASTGSVQRDLVDYLTLVSASLSDPQAQGLVRALISLPEEEVADARRAYWHERYKVPIGMLQAGIQRGELDASIDPAHIVDLLLGPIWMRVVITSAGIDADGVERIVTEVLARITPTHA